MVVMSVDVDVDVVGVVVGGLGAATPVEGISPAWPTLESMHARATANVKRLILLFSLWLGMPVYWHENSIVHLSKP